MKKILLIVIGAILVLVAGFFALNDYIYQEKQGEDVAGEPTFEWKYRTLSGEEIPRTVISLVGEYTDGTVQEEEIDTIAGDCNVYLESDADMYAKSEMIICYYAGLGHYYKVVESTEEYLVQRRVFEEASPDYTPPVESFETVARFPKL